MVFARRWARSRPLAGYQGCRRGPRDYGGPTAGQTEPYGPRVHRSRSTFAAPLTHGQSLSASKKREAHMEYRSMTTETVSAAMVPSSTAWRSLLWFAPLTTLWILMIYRWPAIPA